MKQSNFIELTLKTGKKVSLNFNLVTKFTPLDEGTEIFFDDSYNYCSVIETYDEIKTKI